MKTEISLQRLKSPIAELVSCRNELNRIGSELTYISEYLKLSENDALIQLAKKLGKESESVYHNLKSMKVMEETLEKVYRTYDRFEDSLLDDFENGIRIRKLIATVKPVPIKPIALLLDKMELSFKL